MNFFEAQEKARAASRRLVLWFALCVTAVVVVLYLVAVVAKPFVVDQTTSAATRFTWWDPELAIVVAPAIGGIIILGSLFKLLQLSAGGAVVARDLGGRQVDPATRDPLERRLLNVVDEMAIASGIPAPEVWVLDQEEGINAFAAGSDPSNAVVGVTRGCLERLNRAELQGVIAHEFSHVLNGDMKLNMRLIGWIFGLIMIAMLGRMLLEMLRYSRGSRDSRGNGAIMAVVAAGVVMWLVGSIGVIFARLLQASVSRQREYLADASAVQFTRNPDGLADALRKVGGFSRNGAIQTSKAAEARHMFFARSDFAAMAFSTHPPIEDRIKAIDPAWDGGMLKPGAQEMFADEAADLPRESRPKPPPLPGNVSGFGGVAAAAASRAPAGPDFRAEMGSKTDAKALMLGLLLMPADQPARRVLRERASEGMARHAEHWAQALANRPPGEKLDLIDLSLPWLRRMNRDEAAEFLVLTRELIAADGRMDLREFMLQKVLERQVEVGVGLRPVVRIRHQSLAALRQETAVLVGSLAGISGDQTALAAAAREFRQHTGQELPRLRPEAHSLETVARALTELEAATPLVKVQVLRLCALVVTHDGVVEEQELQLLRAAAEAIGAPMPPLVAAA